MLTYKELKSILFESLWSADKGLRPLDIKVTLDADNTQYWLIKARELLSEALETQKEKTILVEPVALAANHKLLHDKLRLTISILLMTRAKNTFKVTKLPKDTPVPPKLTPPFNMGAAMSAAETKDIK
jgi:hypothetical protein